MHIEIKEGRTTRFYQVEKLSDNGKLETYRIWNDSISITLQSNRPLLRGKGLKSKPPIWKQTEGDHLLGSEFDRIVEALMKEIR